MAVTDKWESKIQSADFNLLDKGYRMLVDEEIELERRLKDIQEAKVRFMVEIDIRLNNKNQ